MAWTMKREINLTLHAKKECRARMNSVGRTGSKHPSVHSEISDTSMKLGQTLF